MTDLLTFIEATKGTSLKIEVTSKDLLEFADALVERAAARPSTATARLTGKPIARLCRIWSRSRVNMNLLFTGIYFIKSIMPSGVMTIAVSV